MTPEEEVKLLRQALSQIKHILEKETEVLISFDIEDNRPYKSVRLYTMNGIALGKGEMKVNDSRNIGDQEKLFDNNGNVTYTAKIIVKPLFGKAK